MHLSTYYHKGSAVNVPLHLMDVTQHGISTVNHPHRRTSEAQPLVHGRQSLNMQTIMLLVALTAVQSPPSADAMTASKIRRLI